jgi:transformation/transcription domain-associated protein
MSIGRCLTEPEVCSYSRDISQSLTSIGLPQFDLDQQLSLFLRDEVLTWSSIYQKPTASDLTFRHQVVQSADGVVKKAELLSCRSERENVGHSNTNPNCDLPCKM